MVWGFLRMITGLTIRVIKKGSRGTLVPSTYIYNVPEKSGYGVM